MIEQYLEAAIRQAQERAKVLKGKIPNPVRAPELISLQRLCEERIDSLISQLDYLLTDALILRPDLIGERMRLFRRLNKDLTGMETTAIAALSRIHPDDIALNKIVFQIHAEINFPLTPPTVTCLSRDYFGIDTSLHLLEVPLVESDFLLHLPDLYHELAHLLIATQNNPKVEPFRHELAKFLGRLSQHFDRERATNLRSTGPKEYFAYVLDRLERAWVNWAIELFCDLFATYTLGLAYVWSHFHLTAKREGDPWDVRLTGLMSHPPDQARMEAMLIGLDLIGLAREGEPIQRAWNALLRATHTVATPLYQRACPRALLEQAAIHALEGTKNLGCRIARTGTGDRVHNILNTAWNTFWTSPNDYHHWERECVAELKRTP
jgi:hypothetical protein